jgi:SAM-dependent methyltransferase
VTVPDNAGMTGPRARRLDVGSGTKRREGFVGLDRFPMPGVSVVADLDRAALPFAADSFDLVVAFHSLEHVEDLLGVMREIWRVGRPGAQVCIVAPYFTSGLNLANPYHKQAFNEHTPRFWTDSAACPIPGEEWQQPPLGAQWGLASSDNSAPGLDLRIRRMEFLYFREYWGKPEARQRRARRSRLDVCEQILYHLTVFKPPMTEADLERQELAYYMPPELEERRRDAAGTRRGWLSSLVGG